MLSTQTSNPAFKIITNNNKMKLSLSLANEMAKTSNPIIIHGDNGTGKNLFAKHIHQQSSRCSYPLISLPSNSHNDIDQQIKTCMDDVQMGTLLLDRVQDLDLEFQHTLHKHLSHSEQQKFRIITTTSSDLEKLSETGEFLPELLTILQGGYIELLPLQDRREDISSLATFYVEHLCQVSALPNKNISAELLHILNAYHWPGNVRELVSTVVQLVITSQFKQTLFPKDLPAHIRIQTLKFATAQKQGL